MLGWIIKRLRSLTPAVILATTTQSEDRELVGLARFYGIEVWQGSETDVIGRMEEARVRFAPRADFVLRGLGDCPFMATELIARSVGVMRRMGGEVFRWHLAPHVWPVYGSREFPYEVGAWERVVERSGVREHVDTYYLEHTGEFDVVWHEAPSHDYFRPYRLEVDWPEDLELVRAIGEEVGMLAPVPAINRFLDEHHDVAMINNGRVERTGLVVSYDYEVHRSWLRAMQGKPVVTWDDKVWYPPSGKAEPVFCESGQCLVGFSLGRRVLFTREGKISGEAMLDCACGSGRRWGKPKRDGAWMLSASMLFL